MCKPTLPDLVVLVPPSAGKSHIGFSLTVVVVAAALLPTILVTWSAETAMSEGSPAATKRGRPKLGSALAGVSGLVESTSGVDGLLLRHLRADTFMKLSFMQNCRSFRRCLTNLAPAAVMERLRRPPAPRPVTAVTKGLSCFFFL